jgi:hypothetical protein
LHQSYIDIHYGLNININSNQEKLLYNNLLQDFLSDQRLKIIYNSNKDQHTNYLNAIKSYNSLDYDLFIKIDDDDIYHKDYIKKSIEYYSSSDCDILSYIPKHHINNNKIKDSIRSIGVWGPDTESSIKFGMPPTYIFNRKACDIILNITLAQAKKIHHFEDGSWRTYWRQHNLKSKIIEDFEPFTYNIHNKNTSSAFLLDQDVTTIQNEHCCIAQFRSHKWQSYIYLNKRNNRLYNINNDDHGSFKITGNKIIIDWDNWGKEEFVKEQLTDKIYVYNLVK